jgi:23S rRNA (guanosine2251-2'-O)-methyltransferase
MQTQPQSDPIILEGAISIEAALHAGLRPINSIMVHSDKSGPAIFRIEREAGRRGIPVTRVDAATLHGIIPVRGGPAASDSLSSGGSHGGVIAIAGPRRFVPLEELANSAAVTQTNPLSIVEATPGKGWVVMIDGVEDPYNFGAAVRSAYAAGAAGLVVRDRNWFTAAGLVARASAGASEAIPTAIAGTVDAAADVFRAAGYAIVCAGETPDAVSLYDADLTGRFFLLIGGEKRGVTRSFREQADLTLRIPYGNRSAQSLGTAAATAVIAFEVLRQRLQAGHRHDAAAKATESRNGQRSQRPPLLGPHRRR